MPISLGILSDTHGDAKGLLSSSNAAMSGPWRCSTFSLPATFQRGLCSAMRITTGRAWLAIRATSASIASAILANSRWRDDWVEAPGKRSVRIINPGALHNPKTIVDGERQTPCAMLHLNTGRLEKIVVAMAGV
jgi:hypothetical protein